MIITGAKMEKINRYCWIMDYNKDNVLVYNAVTKKILILNKEMLTINIDNKSISARNDFSYSDSLKETNTLLDTDIPELSLIKHHCNNCYNKISLKTKSSIVFVLTNECNFDCEYCFENSKRTGFEKKFGENGFVSDEVVQNTIKLAKRISKKSKHFKLSLYGGEPLLIPKKTIDIIDLFYEAIKSEEKDFSLQMTTNGYNLTKDVTDHLSELDLKELSLQISLDGTKEVHNSRRKLKNGGTTFDTILSNIKYLLDNYNGEIELYISPVVDKTNSNSVLELGKQYGVA
jgi:uncharacterized protein